MNQAEAARSCSLTFGVLSAEEAQGMTRADLEGDRALVVDDNETSRHILIKYLMSWGCLTCQAGSALDALSVLQEADKDGQSIQVLLSDTQMAGLSGYDLAKEIRRRESLDWECTVLRAMPGFP